MDQLLILLEHISSNQVIHIIDEEALTKFSIKSAIKMTEDSLKQLFGGLFKIEKVVVDSKTNNLDVYIEKKLISKYKLFTNACVNNFKNIVYALLAYFNQDDYNTFACSTLVELYNDTSIFDKMKFDEMDYQLFSKYIIEYEKYDMLESVIKHIKQIDPILLCFAIKNNNTEVIKTLLTHGNFSGEDFKKNNPILWAFKYGNEDVIDFYCKTWAKDDEKRKKYVIDTFINIPCIMLAKHKKHIKLVEKYGDYVKAIKDNPTSVTL
jgi:hypothetical protein